MKKQNKKGFVITDLMIFGISAIVVILFFGGWIFGFGQVTTLMNSIGTLPNTEINMTQISQDTIGQLNNGFQFLRLISFLMIFGYMLSILLTAFLMRKHPALAFIVYIFITILSFIFAVYISNEYENLLLNSVLGPTLQQFTASNFFMANLPTLILVLGFGAMILLFSGMPRDTELGGGVF